MEYNSIADIYSANQTIRKRFQHTVDGITPDEANAELEGEKWTVAALIEHVSIVEFNMSRICAKLLAAAKETGKPGDGSFSISSEFAEKSAEIAEIKFEAPEMVHPQGGVATGESIEKLGGSTVELEAMRSDFESLNVSEHKFPHPFFGGLTAAEWLLLAGRHEARHLAQIERLLAKIRQ
ncbi:MAG: DinB family protein [Pyrinomonadaceae bacterium]